MRIVVYHNLPSGGAKRAVYEWTARLAARHNIDVYTSSCADHAFCDIRTLVEQHHVFDFAPRALFASPWGRLNQLQRWRDLGELTRISRVIACNVNRAGYDVVFAHPCRYTVIPALLSFVEIPAIYYLHEPFGRTFIRQFERPYFRNNKWRRIVDRFDPFIAVYTRRLARVQTKSIRRTTRLLANSQFTRQRMKLAHQVDAPVCYYGVDTEDFRPMPHIRKENFLISVGEMTPRKGFDFLIESLALLPAATRPELRLACNWESPAERRYIDQLAARHNVGVRVLTRVNTEQLAVAYNKAQLCVYAPVLEPFGLVPLESMACGTPVVGVAEGGVRESVLHNETGLLTERDPHAFAEAVQMLLNSPTRRAQFGRRGRAYVETEWQWDRSVRVLEQHLESVACKGESRHIDDA